MKNLILLSTFISMIVIETAYSQIRCGTDKYLEYQLQDSAIRVNYQIQESKLREFLRTKLSNRDPTIYRIPVVVHIVMEDPDLVSDSRIHSQIDVLNQDFRKLNMDLDNTPSVFQNLISDTKFEFYLANVGENCNGITRTTIEFDENGPPCFIENYNLIKSTFDGGHDAIDPVHLLNIWVGPICMDGVYNPQTDEYEYAEILGYTQMPGAGVLENDGVAILPRAFGIGGDYPYHKGRTATHEIGHYFSLKHIWGDTELCDPPDDDGVEDTPEQDWWYNGCPAFPKISCNNGPNGDLINNFMQYVDDECMFLFTHDQSDKMEAALNTGNPNMDNAYTPILTTYDITMTCAMLNYDLNDLQDNSAPPGSILVWSTDGDLSDGVSPIIDSHVQDAGVYYAYFYNGQTTCYNGPSQGVYIHAQDIHITIDTEYPSAMEVFGNIYVENGATLTIYSNISFGPSSSIFVESGSHLILDGGKLTACAQNWRGIKVSGELTIGFTSQLPGEVELIHGAIIEKADIGIDGKDLFSSPPYSFSFEYGGGIISLNNSTLQNCDIGIKFAPYGWGSIIGSGAPAEQSVINLSTIQDCGTAIYSDGNIGLEITNNTFEDNYNDYEGSGSTITAEGNTFTSDLLMYSDFPSVPGSTFESNNFINNFLEIQSQGNFTTFKINRNTFLGAGFIALGELWYEISQNDYYDSFQGNGTGDTGENISNFIRDNAFYNNEFANSVWGVNDVQYITNCFENTDFTDIELYHGASVFIQQGVEELSAGNCFASGGRIETGTATEQFTYWTKDGYNHSEHCKNPGNGNFTIQLAQFEADQELCGTGTQITDLPAIYRDCQCYFGVDGCRDAIEAIQDEIESLENNTTIDPLIKAWLLAKYKQCLDKLFRTEIQSSLSRGEVEETILFLYSQSEFRYQVMGYGILNHNREYNASRTYLNSLQTTSQDQIDFVITQNIYLDYITDISNFALSPSDRLILEEAGEEENELSGYARAVYFRLTGEKIELDLHHLDGTITPRNSENQNRLVRPELFTSNIMIYPNPVDIDFIEIVIKGYNPDKNYSIRIYDLYGRQISLKRLVSEHEMLMMEESVRGIFFATIFEDGLIISNQKLIKL